MISSTAVAKKVSGCLRRVLLDGNHSSGIPSQRYEAVKTIAVLIKSMGGASKEEPCFAEESEKTSMSSKEVKLVKRLGVLRWPLGALAECRGAVSPGQSIVDSSRPSIYQRQRLDSQKWVPRALGEVVAVARWEG